MAIRLPLSHMRGKRRPSLGLLDESVLDMRVRLGDIDLWRHVNNGRYLTLCDLGRTDYAARCGLTDAVRSQGWSAVAAGGTIRFRRELPLWSRYRLSTRLLGWTDEWLFFEQRFTTADGKLAALAWMKIAPIGRGRRIPVREVLAAGGWEDVPKPTLPPELHAWQSSPAS